MTAKESSSAMKIGCKVEYEGLDDYKEKLRQLEKLLEQIPPLVDAINSSEINIKISTL